jgi:hypothetical protein
MTTKLHRESAQIYKFPEGGRAAIAGRRERTQPVVADGVPVRTARLVVGKNWYHDEAIQIDAEDADGR